MVNNPKIKLIDATVLSRNYFALIMSVVVPYLL